MFRVRSKKHNYVLPLFTSPKKKPTSEGSWIIWINLGLSALIPLSIGIGTVVLTIIQQHVDTRRQNQERELDDRRYQMEQGQANELHYQDVFKTYIEDISNVLFKSNSSVSFLDNEMKLNYIRSKTVVALEYLDWERRTRLFLFLYEHQIVGNSSVHTIDLSRANLKNILIDGLPFRTFQFCELRLQSTHLTNLSFIGCDFNNGADFRDSIMIGTKFTYTRFTRVDDSYKNVCLKNTTDFWFDRSKMKEVDFSGAFLSNMRFNDAGLSYSNFSNTWIQGILQFVNTNLTRANFPHCSSIVISTSDILQY